MRVRVRVRVRVGVRGRVRARARAGGGEARVVMAKVVRLVGPRLGLVLELGLQWE